MERTTWGQINELFEAARRLPAEEREAWVRAATTDERVQSEVLSLLHAHEDEPWFVDQPWGSRTPPRVTPAAAWPGRQAAPSRVTPSGTPLSAGRPAAPTPTPSRLRPAMEPKAGGQFASYRLVREIARDPARIVFEAVAAGSSAHPRVALHVLTADGSDPAAVALIHAHGDRLARLDHPAIPRLTDGGVTAEGSVYLASEYATGDAIDEWCRQRRLSLRDRVDRIIDVCGAVQHAHEHLVAHGDLRPSNVLVSADAKLKVINCGMAALLRFEAGPGGAAAPVHPYMSPEQARGDVLTATSDVYALGILLYTLLTGYPPYELGGQTPARARHMICETTPDVPSTIVGEAERRQLAGTLDAVILKALSKSPRERYATAAALAADLRAWRDGRPASVAPAGAWSRAGTGSRWRAVPLGAALVIVALAAGAAALGWEANRLRAERDQARAGLPDAGRQQQALEAQLAPRPVADLRLQVAASTSELALAERRRGDAARAEALWSQSLADVRPLLDADPVDVRVLEFGAGVRSSLGSLSRSQRRFDDALAHYREALRARERAAGMDGAPPAAQAALAGAQVDVARLLLDLVEIRPPGPNDGPRLREAGALLAQADPTLRGAAAALPATPDARAELDRQAERLRRLTVRRR